jgi:hypothetical protein
MRNERKREDEMGVRGVIDVLVAVDDWKYITLVEKRATTGKCTLVRLSELYGERSDPRSEDGLMWKRERGD